MARNEIDRATASASVRTIPIGRRVIGWLVFAMLLIALVPWPAQAQFGMLKKLKTAMANPDSAARVKDSLAQIAAGVHPDSVKIGKGLLARGVSAASTASNKLEEHTGISAKDAALAATGLGAGALIAKKMGSDPTSLGAQAINKAKLAGQQRAMNSAAGTGVAGIKSKVMGSIPGMGAMTGMGSMPGMDAATIQAMQKAMGNAGTVTGKMPANPGAAMLGGAMAGITEADVRALASFQQEMMQVAMAASGGDAAAQARLEAWSALAVKHEPEIERLSLAASGGDMAAIQKLQRMQFTMVKEWANTHGTKGKLLKAVRP